MHIAVHMYTVQALDAKNEGDFKLAVARNPVLTLCSKFPKYPPHPTPGLIHETHLVLFFSSAHKTSQMYIIVRYNEKTLATPGF